MLSAVLVQLFGREVIDRLALAGFDSAEAIASAEPERLADESGIPLALARRIIAVAAEERGEPAFGEEPAPAGPAPAERHVRRPFRRPQHSSLTRPDPDEDGAEEEGAKAAAAPKPAAEDEEPVIDPDPFVDDAGLVSWMGFATRHGASPAAPFTVADAILDPGPASLPEAVTRATRSPDSSAARSSEPPGRPASPPSPAPSPAPAGARGAGPRAEPEGGANGPLEGSFWSFGVRREDKPATAPPPRPGLAGPPEGIPRRRSRDGH
jgi:hypothetical protein